MRSFPLRRRPFLAAVAGLAAVSGTAMADSPRPLPKIGIIGAGQVGRTLATLWVQAGYQVMVSARTLADATTLAVSLGSSASAGTPAQAAAFGSIVVLAVPYGAIPALGRDLNRTLTDKVVIDVANPYIGRDGWIADVALRDGAGVTTQRYFPSAHIVRAFNSIDMVSLRAEAHRPDPKLAVPIAGDDTAAVLQVKDLVYAAGLDPVVTGGLATAKLFQPGSTGFELERDAAGLRSALHLHH
ncbi:NADPH-dependent F420 reductase [Gluconobacter japonicus]|uniref:NADPH-dependent F420 reductase n=1 Tax=Gluconobacter japonicus TaxID=376620 RepID=UPI001B8AFB6D|nr:NAD(P)-binding domain-containing protein [Gluconobacter japonicus]MBS1051399.1 NAD(P)-binding domain-containing protein [Gluconobacter japonicus]